MRKTKTFFALILMLILCTCTQNNDSPLDNENLDSRMKNNVAASLLKFLNEKPEVYSQCTRALNKNEPEYNYAVLSSSTRFGNYYCVPYSQNGVVQGCIIYPTSHNDLETGEYIITGLTGEIIRMDNDYLNNTIPDDERYLYSVHFLNWVRRDKMKVNPTLTAYAKLMELNSKPSPSFKAKSDVSTRATLSEWTIANVHMKYQTSSIESGGGILAPNLSALIRWIEDFLQAKTKPRSNINEFQVYRRLTGTVEINISFEGAVYTQELHYLMHELILNINSRVFSSSHCYFDATYTYDLQHGGNSGGGGGGGSTGGGGTSGGSGELIPPPVENEDPPQKKVDPSIKCNDLLTEEKEQIRLAWRHFLGAKEDLKYNYIDYNQYLDAVKKDPTKEHGTSLYEFEDPEDGKFYRLEHVQTGTANSVAMNTSMNVIATLHNHPNETPPSFRDALFLAENARYKLKHSYIYLPEQNLHYVLTITDKEKARQFEQKYRYELNYETNWVKNDGKLKNILEFCDKSFGNLDNNSQMIYTLERIFAECDAGMAILEIGSKIAGYWSEKTKTIDKKGKEKITVTLYTCE